MTTAIAPDRLKRLRLTHWQAVLWRDRMTAAWGPELSLDQRMNLLRARAFILRLEQVIAQVEKEQLS